MKSKFQRKVFKVFLMVSLVPLLVLGMIDLWTVIETRQQSIVELTNLALDVTSEKIQKYITQKSEVLNLVVSTNQSIDVSQIDKQNLGDLLDNLSKTAGDITAMAFVSMDGREVVKFDQAATTTFSVVENEQPYFQEVLASGRYFGPLEFRNGRPLMKLAGKIENSDRVTIGVIWAEVDLGKIEPLMNEIRLGEKGSLFVFDKNNLVLAGSDQSRLAAGSLEKPWPFINQIKAQKNDRRAYQVAEVEGQRVIVNGRAVGLANLFIAAEWPRADAFSVIFRVLEFIMLIVVLTLIFLVVTSLLAAKRIVKPIQSLIDGAQQVAGGNLDYQVEIKTRDEFELLGENFNNMSKVLKENAKLKDEFVFIAAHELRTPVTAIKGYVSMMIDGSFGKVPAKMQSSLETVFNANERLVQLVQDLLEVARSESGKMNLTLAPVKIQENIRTVLSELKPLADKKGIILDYQPPAGELAVAADSYKLNEILINLIGNAIKYTLGQGTVTISHKVNGGYLETYIADTGMGMAPEEVGKLFAKFYRVKTDETAKIEGTGLGLFICKQIIEKMEGRIWATSELGNGSVFAFSLKIISV
jgi:signal transduction histidine kinase